MQNSSAIELTKLLTNGIELLNLSIPITTQQKLLEYITLLQKWNKTYNLTAITDAKEIVIRHILDSLAIAPYITGDRILDVGTGAGLPGIPLALSLPEKQFVLLDSNSKKIRFLIYVKATLKITNIEIIHKRVEEYLPQLKFDNIVTRAFSSLQDMLDKTKHLYNTNGCLLAMKGKYPEQELQQYLATVQQINVPYLAEQRHLICINNPRHE
jgi:16S rRNA (guanine527-N7)-methyltransferase